jgi:molybdate transport system substrate-binding protein
MRKLVVAFLMASALAGRHAASAAEVKVLTAGAFKSVVAALVPGFERRSGDKVAVDNDTAGKLMQRIAAGESFDVVILTPPAIDQLAQSGKVAPGSAVRLARVAIGVAVRQGAPLPDIATVAAFEKTLLAARKVAYIDPTAGGSSGIYLAQLFERLGIADKIKPKAVLVPGGLVAEHVADGEADLGIHQISEILAVPGATLVGPIPAEIQSYTFYAGAVSATARDGAASRAFLAALGSKDAQAVLKEKGMEAP